jgi:uncharacterized membrane protein (Fun14 family)
MEEVIPVGSGVVLGLIVAYVVRSRFRLAALAGGSVLLGLAASWLTGELAVSWIYLPIDIAQVLAAAALTWVLAARWRRHAAGAHHRSA